MLLINLDKANKLFPNENEINRKKIKKNKIIYYLK